MRFSTRGGSDAAAGTGTIRTHRDFRTLLARVQEGDIVVIDRRDLDAGAAQALAELKPFAVLNASEFVSGRFANLGPARLADAGVVLLEGDPGQVRALKDGTVLRLEGGTLYDGTRPAVDVRHVTADEIGEQMDRARSGMSSQLDTLAHTASEFLRREEGVLLQGTGLPELRTDLAGRTVVVVGPQASASDIRALRTFLREERPVLVGIDGGAELVGRRLDVLVLSADAAPTDRVLRRAREVVLHGAGESVRRQVGKLNIPVHTVATGAASTDVALLVAHQGGARLVVPVGDPATLDELIDRERSDQASTFLTRLRLGNTVVDAAAVPLLYTGRVRRWHLALVLLAVVAVLVFTVAATPIGNDWWHNLVDGRPGWLGGDQ
ncbi:MAG TPA: putative cytokinetic ring protein SteA [Marmoricola sp.]|nr:putative cytokinetic ring protein SteA [Marmoricola sp.]